ncbi:MAG: hypothetical protein LLG01_14905 [Planctomycetaceae bacterium]|nr:hypothetical protein [Planctomycetaceae bacterium]
MSQPLPRPGDRVRLRPAGGGDIFDLALDGRTAIVSRIECDLEGRRHIAVVLEDDPGADLGLMQKPGHCFFFAGDEVEPLTSEE